VQQLTASVAAIELGAHACVCSGTGGPFLLRLLYAAQRLIARGVATSHNYYIGSCSAHHCIVVCEDIGRPRSAGAL
jgi:hypothetical protein